VTAPGKVAILDLANVHAGASERAAYRFTKRELLRFTDALLKLAEAGADAARLDALAEAAGFMRGTAGGAPAFRVFGNDSWHPDLRTAIDDHQRDRARAAREDS
jgi:hypothetical protein